MKIKKPGHRLIGVFLTVILVAAQIMPVSAGETTVSGRQFTVAIEQVLDQSGLQAIIPPCSTTAITREKAASVLQSVLHLADAEEPFTDVLDNSNYAGAIGAIYKAGIIFGTGNGQYGYGKALTPKQVPIIQQRLKTYYAQKAASYQLFKVASLQFNPEMYNRDENIANLCTEVEKLFAQGVKLVVAPEMCTTGYGYTSRKDIAPYVDTLPGKATNELSALTAKYDAYIVFGMPEVDPSSGLYYNSAALVGPEGYIGKYRKTHQWETEEHWAAWGDLGVPVYATEIGNIAINICMDSAYFESARLAAIGGADILAFPTNSSAQAISALPARAMQNGLFIVSANRSNTELGFHMIGASATWSPYGDKLAEVPLAATTADDVNAATSCIATIDPALYVNTNKSKLRERCTGLYKELSLYTAPWDYTASTESQHVKAIALQYEPVAGDTNANKEKIRDLMQGAAGVDLVVLPELSLTGPVEILAGNAADYVNVSDAASFAAEIAAKYKTAVIIGAIAEENGKLYNASIIVDKNGKTVGTYYKTHLSVTDKTWATAGSDLPVFTVAGIGKIGMLIGDDVCFPEASGVLAVKRADIIAIPSAWYGQYGGFVQINDKISANTFPANTMVLWDAVAEGAQSYTISANFIGTGKNYLGSSALNTLDPLYGLDQPVTASQDKAEALTVEFDTLQLSWWFNQQKLIDSRRTAYYGPLIAD